jgi:membrane complex biogenesis BtpA family protein
MSEAARLVGMVQFLGFPHDPGGPVRAIDTLDGATRDAEALLETGFQTLMLQNLANRSPWRHETIEEVAAFAALLGRLSERLPEVTWGLNLPCDDPEASIAIAQAAGAAFVRLKVWIGVMRRAEGTLEGCANAALAYRHRLRADEVALWTDVHDRTGTPIWPTRWCDGVAEARKAGATTLVVTGPDPATTLTMLQEAHHATPEARLVVGGGATPETIRAFLQAADAVIVGTYLHRDGDERLPVDRARARRFRDAASST